MKHILFFICTFLLQLNLTANTTKVLIKANIIKGESTVTPYANPEKIEKIFENALLERNIKRVQSQLENDETDLLYLDAFVYQLPSSHPMVSLVIRSKNGVHYFDNSHKKLYGNRVSTINKVAEKMAENIPQEIDVEKIESLYFSTLLSVGNSFGNFAVKGAVNSIMNSYRIRYDNELKWLDNEPIPFIVRNFNAYLSYCVDYQGFRQKVKAKKLILKLNLGADGRLSIGEIDAPFKMDSKIERKLYNLVAALPQWIAEETLEGIELHLGTRSKMR